MELVQVNWDENADLFLKFQKDQDEIERIQPENIKNISVQYNLYKKANSLQKSPPFWFSTRKTFFSNDLMGVAIELEEIHNTGDVLIDLLSISIKYNSGKKEIFHINEEFPLEEIFIDSECYLDFPKPESKFNGSKNKITIKQKQSIKISTMELSDIKKISLLENNKSKQPIILNKDRVNSSDIITIDTINDPTSLSEIRDLPALMFIMRETFSRLNIVEQELRETNATLREVALRNAEALSKNSFSTHPSIPNQPSLVPPPSVNAQPQRKLALGPPKSINSNSSSKSVQIRTEVIREMKSKFQNISDVKELLQKVPEDILKRDIPRTNYLSFCEFKENQMNNEE